VFDNSRIANYWQAQNKKHSKIQRKEKRKECLRKIQVKRVTNIRKQHAIFVDVSSPTDCIIIQFNSIFYFNVLTQTATRANYRVSTTTTIIIIQGDYKLCERLHKCTRIGKPHKIKCAPLRMREKKLLSCSLK
jgi:hypothetical protein